LCTTHFFVNTYNIIGTIRLSGGDALPNVSYSQNSILYIRNSNGVLQQEQVAGNIDSVDAQISPEVFSDNGVKVSHDQKASLEAAFSKGVYFTSDTLRELGGTTGLPCHEIMVCES
jgi:hypothetical protein